ncbi:hypothetical protein CIPAW_03G224400 [Carya illinoinensis]|uniref:Uncharacterized protein n=1 Tax=Carya illinoinensis TaxID=32201 RepID=A0A8T1R6R9_CARIL|nr:hypothetical protein CIPAW_03G224400 [Carya illinoinensis]
MVTDEGFLALLNRTNNIVWSSNSSRRAENPVAQLLDNGNLVVKDGNANDPNEFLWRSFDYPCDTLLPEMKIGRSFVTGIDRFLSSWKSAEDPAQGQFSLRIDPHGFPQLVVLNGARIKARAGPWNGLHFTGYPLPRQNSGIQTEFVLNENGVYYEFTLGNSSALTRVALNPSGTGELFIWADETRSWQLFFTLTEADQCENYALCGAFSTCNPSSSIVCACLEGFIPKSRNYRNSIDQWFNGCVRSTPLECNGGDGFRKYTGMKLPDTTSSWFNKTMSLRECEEFCLENCSCTAYSNLDIRGKGSGCLIWFGDLNDIKVYSQGGQELYIKMASSELGTTNNSELTEVNNNGNSRKREVKMPSFASVSAATDNFLAANKLGEGGFGPVYKGILVKGEEVAVKRLSRRSSQGWEELKNEAMVIAKLQHKNLVRLLGCCIERDEKILVYEYMPNKSLDFILFDSEKRRILDWGTRVRVN